MRGIVLSLFLTVILSGCATKPTETAVCEQADWYELGRRDGSQGFPTDRLTQHQKECAKRASNEWETMYTNGRNAGLVEYCDPKNAYELGRSGVAYFYVCPSTVEPQFVSAYRKGQTARELEMQNQKLDDQINTLAQKLLQANDTFERRQLTSQLDQLKSSRSKNEKELTKISK